MRHNKDFIKHITDNLDKAITKLEDDPTSNDILGIYTDDDWHKADSVTHMMSKILDKRNLSSKFRIGNLVTKSGYATVVHYKERFHAEEYY